MKSIVLHDYFKYMEGGGRLSLILAYQLNTDLGYGFKVANHPYFDSYPINAKEFNMDVAKMLPGWQHFCLSRAFLRHTGFLRNYHTVLYSGSYAPLAAIEHYAKKNIFYCHTPPRYIYDQRAFYYSRYPVWLHPFLDLMIAYHQPLYEAAVERMDTIVTNSHNVKNRIKDYLGYDALVVYPPCETKRFKWIGQDDYYLSAGRLDPLKRVGIIVDAFKKMPDKNLVVVSDGPELKRIRQSAAPFPNIKVLGRVSDDRYRRLVGECIATIYIPRNEDFGMTPIESMAAGKPVIGVNEGGLVESIRHDVNGLLLAPDPTVNDVIEAVRRIGKKKAKQMKFACIESAMAFDVNRFVANMKQFFN